MTQAKASSDEKKPLIDYPTTYQFKVMGLHDGFREHVRHLFGRLIGSEVAQDSIEEAQSSKGKYLSLTVTVFLKDEPQRQGIYAALHADEKIIYYL